LVQAAQVEAVERLLVQENVPGSLMSSGVRQRLAAPLFCVLAEVRVVVPFLSPQCSAGLRR
jgi:hypothetical protein